MEQLSAQHRKVLDIERYMPKVRDYNMAAPEEVAKFCSDSNEKLARYDSPLRIVAVPIVKYKLMEIKAEDVEDFMNLSLEEKTAYAEKYKEYRSKFGTPEKIELPKPLKKQDVLDSMEPKG
jgi:hypothetical protein